MVRLIQTVFIISTLFIVELGFAQVVIYQQNFDGNNGAFSNTILSEITPTNGWLASSTAAQYLGVYRHVWNLSTQGVGNYAPITGRSLGIGLFNGNNPLNTGRPFQTWNGTNCGLFAITYRWAYIPISTVGFENIQVEFKWRCEGEVDAGAVYDYGTVNTSIDGGATWLLDESGGAGGTTGANGTYAGGLYYNNAGVQTQIINLPASRDNNPDFALAFRAVVDECFGSGGGFIIDDIIVRGTPIGGCAGGTAAPAYQFVQTNNNATVSVTGFSGANIQWQVSPNGVSGWTDISGATSASYTTGSLANGSYFYRARISDVSCTEFSTNAEVFVAAAPVYCSGAGIGNSFFNNHIEDVAFHEWSDPNPGYVTNNYLDYSDTTTYGYATVVAGQYHHFNATIRANGTGTASTTVAAWIDFNGDGVFDNTPFSSGGELMDIVNFSSTVGNTYAAYFTVPASASGIRRIRLRALRGNFGSIDPCGNYTNSQTKDFTLRILPSIGNQVCGTVNGNADVVLTNSTIDKVNISRVWVQGPSGTLIDNTGQFFGVQVGSNITMYNYSNMMGAFSNGLVLEAGQNYSVTIEHSGYTCAAGVFIDYNGDGDFDDANELVARISDPAANPFVFNFTVPTGVTDGLPVAMRVRLRYDQFGNLGTVINACNNISDGLGQYSEVEDYRAILSSPTLVCNTVSNLSASIGAPANGLQHHLDVNWDPLSGATNYDVEVSTDGVSYGSLQNVTSSSFDFNAGDNPNAPYWFRVRARDASQVCTWTPTASPTYTACDVPAAPLVNNASPTTLDVALVPETPTANPSITEYSILSSTTGQYVQANGTLGATEVFQTAASWSTITVSGLGTETEYCFVATARNQDGDTRGGINSISGVETFTTNVLDVTFGSGPTNVWWSPSSCTTGGMVYFPSGGCPGGNVGFDGSFNNFYGCFLRSPAQNCTGLNTVVMTLDLSNSFFASQPNDRVYFNMWAPTASSPGGTYIAADKVNGVSTDELFFSSLRNCEFVEVEFDLSSVTDKSAILFYLNASCAYNNSNVFSVRFDNISILEGASGTCLSTTAAPFPDLVVESISPSAGTICGSGSATYDVVIRNNGVLDVSPGTPFDVQASIGNLVCGINSQTQTVNTGLNAGSSTTLSFTLALSGNSDVSFQVDPLNTITEGNESNNCLSDNSVIISNGLSGTYTISASGNYTTVGSAVADLVSQGVCGPVIFDVTGSFNESVAIGTVTGVNSVNTVTFRSADANPANAIIQQSGSVPTIALNSSSYIIFENITIRYSGTSASYGAIFINDNSDNITVRNSILSGVTTTTSTVFAGAVIYASESIAANDCENITIEGNQISGGTHGIFLDMSASDPSGAVITGNTIRDFNRGRGVSVTDYTETLISGNTISNNQTSGASSYGIYISGGVGPNTITDNYIYTTASGRLGYGIYLASPSASGNNSLCANNSVQVTNTTSVAYGIDQTSTTGLNWDILHNTVYVSGGTSSSTFCYRTFGFNDGTRILNNIFVNAALNTSSSNGNQTVQINNATGFAEIDNNCYWTVNAGTPFRGDYVNPYSTFASYIAATGETNSINIDPQMTFVAGIGWKAEAPGIFGIGQAQASVPNDIDGNVRPNPPALGAHENSSTCPPPTIVFTTTPICEVSSSFTIEYSSTQNSPITYSLVANTPALPGFTPIVNQPLPPAPASLNIPIPSPNTAGNYGFSLTINSAGCSSVPYPVTLTILNESPGQWLGFTSSWETPTNWACSQLPDINTDVVIPSVPSGGLFPEINTTGIAQARNLSIATNAKVTINTASDLEIHGDLLNSGNPTAWDGTVKFAGSSVQRISGITLCSFTNLSVESSITSEALKLEQDIVLTGTLNMVQGKFNLDDYSVEMGTTGVVTNENNNARIYGASGELRSQRVLAANSTYNDIAGMGVSISTGSVAPGATFIERGHTSQVAGINNNSIQRYFDIEPSVNSALGATLRINYFDDEMIDTDGINPIEADLIPWRSEDAGATWEGQFFPGQVNRDVAANWVELTGIPAFSRWTLSDWITEPLPVELLSFNAEKKGAAAYISWTTASEINNNYFEVERSKDALNFSPVFVRQGAGNSNQILTYDGYDMNPLEGISYYRLKQVDFDGSIDYSSLVPLRFASDFEHFNAFRNAKGLLEVFMDIQNSGKYSLDIFDFTGRLLYSESLNLSEGEHVHVPYLTDVADMLLLVRVVNTETGKAWIRKVR